METKETTMFTSGYYITAELRLKDAAKIGQAKQALSVLAEKTLTETGCSIFTVHHDTNEPTRFLLWERFDDEQAFKRHFDEPHTRDYMALDLTEVVQYFVSNVLD